MNFAVGSLVKARGREWIVLPESDEEMLILRPLGGTNDEVAGIYLPLEAQDVESAQFSLPDPAQAGDYFSGRLLRDAVRFGFRSSTGPFRSFARIAVEPRPYQLVPLLMALRLDPIRLLISDDVGIGKTVEAGLIAREMLDRKEITRLAVLCPPHLAEQWQAELQDKFHIDAELALSSTITQIERACQQDESVFQHYPFLIISTDFVKSDRYRDTFIKHCPEFVIVDEAHTCAYAGEGRGSRHQRFQLISGLAAKKERHLILVTATPHSGNEDAFRSLLTLLNPDFKALPPDLSGTQNEKYREQLAAQFVQRRRLDIHSYLDQETVFPDRDDSNIDYHLTPEYKLFFEHVLEYARETVKDPSGGKNRQRVRWWSALALLRSLASSPAAAETTLRNRAAVADAETIEEVDQIGRHTVLDLVDQDTIEGSSDVAPGSEIEIEGEVDQKKRNRLLDMADEASQLLGTKDRKLQDAIKLIRAMVAQGYQPLVFCRFIPTAEHVAAELRKALKSVEVTAITGLQPPVEREERIIQLAQSPQRVLVCTDCLSEGINLQTYFNAVIHYDLSWNPTRHEQREGRVDRFGQISPKVRVVTYFGADNQIDGLVLEVLIKKHKSIRKTLGVSVPVPADTEQVLEAVLEGLLLRGKSVSSHEQGALPGFDDQTYQQRAKLDRQWDEAEQRERRTRSTIFAQRSIKVDEVKQELAAVHAAIGEQEDVQAFTLDALRRYGATVRPLAEDNFEVDLTEVPDALRDAININRFVTGKQSKLKVGFNQAAPADVLKLSRTHPLVEGLAAYVMDTALDAVDDPFHQRIAYRSGVMYTHLVEKRTTLLLVRLRFHISTPDDPQPLLVEDCQIFAFRGAPRKADWIQDEEHIKRLLAATPDDNISREQVQFFLQGIIDNFDEYLSPRLNELAAERAGELREAHRRVRRSAALSVRVTVEPQLPPDVLGMYVYLPHQQSQA